jgi:hypothetical protein
MHDNTIQSTYFQTPLNFNALYSTGIQKLYIYIHYTTNNTEHSYNSLSNA